MSLSNNFPAIDPSLLLDFANTKQLDSRITFTRASTATYYDGVTVAKAEENLLTFSQQFENAAWQLLSTTITANSLTAPDETTTADTMSSSTTSLNAVYRNYTTGLTAGFVTASIYAKAGTKSVIQFGANAALTGSADARANFDLSTGTLGSVDSGTLTASIVSAGNGWYRCIITWNRSGSLSASGVWSMQDSTTAAREASSTAGNLYIWGAQLEQRSAVTAYTVTTTQPITNYIPVLLTAPAAVPRFDCNPVTEESLGLLIEEQRANLLTYSADFSNAAWTKTRASISSNTIVAPDGTLTGDKLVEDTSNGTHNCEQSVTTVSSTAYTGTAYLKAAERTWAVIQIVGSGVFPSVFVNLSTGVLGTISGSATASVSSVGNGWYRVQITATTDTTSTRLRVYSATADNTSSYQGNGFSGIYVWGAQLETGSFATSYIATVASSVTRSADAASMTGTNFSAWFSQGAWSIYVKATRIGYTLNSMLFSITDGTLTNPAQAYFDSAAGQIQTNLWSNGLFYKTITNNVEFQYALGAETNNSCVILNADSPSTDSVVGPPYAYSQFNIGNRNGSLMFNGTIKKLAYYPLRLTNAQLQGLTS